MSWSIYTRPDITQRYEILERIGSGSYSDVYRARRLSDNLIVALKEIHDYQSAFREIEALQLLSDSPNVVNLLEYFWREGEDAVLVLEFLRTDLASLIKQAKRNWDNGISIGEIKRWMVQILRAVDDCHRNLIVHRDLKPANLLINDDGVLKLADFGQARILLGDNNQNEQDMTNGISAPQLSEVLGEMENAYIESSETQERIAIGKENYVQELNDFKADIVEGTDKDTSLHDGETSCIATCATSDMEDDPLMNSYSYDIEEHREDGRGNFTSCVGTRWFKAPELLYGSTDYGLEIDLWSLGCIFAELLNLEPLFPGTSDIDQHFRIINVLGNLTEEVWPGCSNLPDYGKLFFEKIERPLGLEGCLANHPNEVFLIRKLLCYNPARRATALELLNDGYFHEEPLPVALNELRVPSTNSGQDERSPGDWVNYNDMESDSDLEEFGGSGFSSVEPTQYTEVYQSARELPAYTQEDKWRLKVVTMQGTIAYIPVHSVPESRVLDEQPDLYDLERDTLRQRLIEQSMLGLGMRETIFEYTKNTFNEYAALRAQLTELITENCEDTSRPLC